MIIRLLIFVPRSQETRDLENRLLGQRRRLWPNGVPTLFRCLVFAGISSFRIHGIVHGGRAGALYTRVVVSTAAFHARVRGSVPGLGGLKETKNVSSPSTCESQYCGEPLWPRGSVLGLRPPGLEFRINHLTILRRFSWPSLAYNYVHKGGLKPD